MYAGDQTTHAASPLLMGGSGWRWTATTQFRLVSGFDNGLPVRGRGYSCEVMRGADGNCEIWPPHAVHASNFFRQVPRCSFCICIAGGRTAAGQGGWQPPHHEAHQQLGASRTRSLTRTAVSSTHLVDSGYLPQAKPRADSNKRCPRQVWNTSKRPVSPLLIPQGKPAGKTSLRRCGALLQGTSRR